MPFDINGARSAGYSDDEITGFLSKQNPDFDVGAAIKSGYKPDEVANFLSKRPIKATPPPQKEGVISRIGQAETDELAKSDQELMSSDYADNQNDSWLKKGVAFIGQKAGAIGRAAISPFKSVAQETIGEGLADTVSGIALDNQPDTANLSPADRKMMIDKLHQTSKETVGGSVASAGLATIGTDTQVGGFKSVKDIRDGIGKASDYTANKAIDGMNWATGKTAPQGGQMSELEPLAEANKGTGWLSKPKDTSVTGLNANQNLSKQYHTNNEHAEQLYSAQKLVGEGKTTPAEDIAAPLNSTISDLQDSAVTPQQASTLRRLKAIQEKYFTNDKGSGTIGDGDVPNQNYEPPKPLEIEVNDLVELKQALNEGFKSNEFTKSSDIPLVKLFNTVKDKIAGLDKQYPDFVEAGNAADTYYGNEVARKFKDNPQLDKLWQPEDYYAWKETLKNPNARGYTDTTLTRAGKFLDSLNSGDEGRVTALINALPREQAIEALHEAILQAKTVTPSIRNAALALLGKSGSHGTVGTPLTSPEMALRNLIGVFKNPMDKAPLLDLADRASPKANLPLGKIAGGSALGYLGYKSFGGSNDKKIPEKGAINVKPQSNNAAIGATNSALAMSKKKGFELSDLNPISQAEASEIKVPQGDSQIAKNVKEFKESRDGPALQTAMKKYGVNPTEMMTLVNAESSVKKVTGNGYAQMTPPAWKQAETVIGRKLNRSNPADYAEASVAYYKWTADQVKAITGSTGTPAMRDVYPAYNAGIGGFKALVKAGPNTRSIDVVPKAVSDNNKYFYYNSNTGTPLTTKQTLAAYKTFVDKKMNEYAPTKKDTRPPAFKATRLATAQAKYGFTAENDY